MNKTVEEMAEERSLKKTCNGCAALEPVSISSKNGEMTCSLRYKIKCTKTSSFIEISHKPLEPCEKPKSLKKLIYLLDKKIIYAPHIYHNPAIRHIKQ